MSKSSNVEKSFYEKLFAASKLLAFIFIIFTLLFVASKVFLLIFAGILFSIFLLSLSQFVSSKTKMPHGWSVATVSLLLLLTIGLGGLWVAPNIADQFDELTRRIPEALEKIQSELEQYSWAEQIFDQADSEKGIESGSKVVKFIVKGIVGGFTTFVIIFFIGMYGTVTPDIYKRGFLYLIPLERRTRVKEVLEESIETLRWWLIGKFIGMAVIGIGTTIGLWILDIPLAIVLGIIAALLTFIPNIGPLLAAIPAVLLGFIDSPQLALYIGLLYLGVQTVESYLITPIIEKKTVSLPPALTLSVQVLLGILFGGLGVALAAPLAAVFLVLTKRLYVEDTLGDHVSDKE